MTKRDLKERYIGTSLGKLWLIFQPLFLLLIYTLVFSKILHVRFSDSLETSIFAFYLMAGLIAFNGFSESLTRAVNSLNSNRNLLLNTPLPAWVLPIIPVVSSIAIELISVVLLVILFGSSAILNIGEGAAFAVDPVAIENYSTEAQHTDPYDENRYLFPSLASGNVYESSIMAGNGEELIVTGWNKSYSCSDDYCDNNPYPMAHALLAPHLMNEYFLDPSQGYDGHTDWVVTNPMKKHGIANDDNDVRVHFENGIFDREESRLAIEGVSPSSPTTLKREVNVLTFVSSDGAYDNSRSVLSSPTATQVGVGPYVHGWARMSYGSGDAAQTVSYDISGQNGANIEWAKRYGPNVVSEDVSSDDSIYSGVPAIGFAALEGNVSSNTNARFGDALPHKIQRDH